MVQGSGFRATDGSGAHTVHDYTLWHRRKATIRKKENLNPRWSISLNAGSRLL